MGYTKEYHGIGLMGYGRTNKYSDIMAIWLDIIKQLYMTSVCLKFMGTVKKIRFSLDSFHSPGYLLFELKLYNNLNDWMSREFNQHRNWIEHEFNDQH